MSVKEPPRRQAAPAGFSPVCRRAGFFDAAGLSLDPAEDCGNALGSAGERNAHQRAASGLSPVPEAAGCPRVRGDAADDEIARPAYDPIVARAQASQRMSGDNVARQSLPAGDVSRGRDS